MSTFDINCEYESANSTVPEHRATWGRLEIWIDGDCVTRFEDLVNRELHAGIVRPLYPLAEWILANWWAIVFEPSHPGRPGYWKRHNLRAAEEGFALPDLEFTSMGDLIEARWLPHAAPHQRANFIGSGTARIPRDEFRTKLLNFVESAIHRLRKRKVEATFVEEEFDALQRLTTDEHEFCRAAGALGIDPYGHDAATADAIESATSIVPREVQEEFFAVAERSELPEIVEELESARRDAERHAFDVCRVASLARPRSAVERSGLPAPVGYQRAKELRTHLGLRPPRLGDRPGAIRLNEIAPGLDDLASDETGASGSRRIDSLGNAGVPGELRLSTGKRRAISRRFALARSIGEYLTLDSPGLFLVAARDQGNGESSTSRQQFNRAFAAELLAPAQTLDAAVGSDSFVSEDQVSEWAEALQVSEMVVAWQLRNHRIANVVS